MTWQGVTPEPQDGGKDGPVPLTLHRPALRCRLYD